jgi:hypothetical protein
MRFILLWSRVSHNSWFLNHCPCKKSSRNQLRDSQLNNYYWIWARIWAVEFVHGFSFSSFSHGWNLDPILVESSQSNCITWCSISSFIKLKWYCFLLYVKLSCNPKPAFDKFWMDKFKRQRNPHVNKPNLI